MSPVVALDPAALRTAAAAADAWLGFRRRYLRLPGLQAALMHRGELLLSCAHGVADVGTGEALRTDHLFRVASHSKSFTATAVLRLAEAGALALDDPLGRWVPALAERGSPLAGLPLRALLEHSGGVARDSVEGAGSGDADYWQGERPFPDVDELVDVLAAPGAAVFGPYQRFKYSNLAYGALGLAAEAAAGCSWADLVRRELIEPLGLRHTEPTWLPRRAAEHASGHTSRAVDEERRPLRWDAATADARALDPATGVSSTAEDLCRWASAHCDGDELVLPAAARRLARHEAWSTDDPSGAPAPPSGDAYGLGWQRLDAGGRRVVGHGGGFPGHATRTAFDPEAQLAVSVCVNAIDGPALALARGVLRLVELAVDGERDPAAAAPGALERFTGRFASLWGVMDVMRLGQRLVAINPATDAPDPFAELRVEADDTLRVTVAPGYGAPGEVMRYRFTGDGDGVVSVRGPGGITYRPWPQH